MSVHTENLYWAVPEEPVVGTGVLVLAGSSGRIDSGRADVLASHGVTALAIRWFGGPGLPDRPCEVPLEIFTAALDVLANRCDRIALLGLSYGAEAALLTATIDARPAAVIAMQPTDVAWEGQAVRDDDPPRSKWTLGGTPVPFVPLSRAWHPPEGGAPAYVELYEQSLREASAKTLAAATIAVDKIGGPLLLLAGGDDQVWPSVPSAERIAARRAAAGRETVIVHEPTAGHRVVLPGEAAPNAARPYLVGGESGSAERLGRAAWPHIARLLEIHDDRCDGPGA